MTPPVILALDSICNNDSVLSLLVTFDIIFNNDNVLSLLQKF
jgi:hypothetical protein